MTLYKILDAIYLFKSLTWSQTLITDTLFTSIHPCQYKLSDFNVIIELHLREPEQSQCFILQLMESLKLTLHLAQAIKSNAIKCSYFASY